MLKNKNTVFAILCIIIGLMAFLPLASRANEPQPVATESRDAIAGFLESGIEVECVLPSADPGEKAQVITLSEAEFAAHQCPEGSDIFFIVDSISGEPSPIPLDDPKP